MGVFGLGWAKDETYMMGVNMAEGFANQGTALARPLPFPSIPGHIFQGDGLWRGLRGCPFG